jgi:hypothetical protein
VGGALHGGGLWALVMSERLDERFQLLGEVMFQIHRCSSRDRVFQVSIDGQLHTMRASS